MNSQRIWLVGVAIWFAAIAVFGGVGGFEQPGPPVALGAAVTLPPLLTMLGWRYVPAFKRAVLALDLRVLVALHIARLEGAVFFVDAMHGELPVQFGIPAGFGDVFAAIGALAILTAPRPSARMFLAWNLLGLLDLVVAVSLGVLYSASTIGVLATPDANTAAIGHLPLVLIPGFYVPLLIATHLVALLRRDELAGNEPSLPARTTDSLLHARDEGARDHRLHPLVAGAGDSNQRIE